MRLSYVKDDAKRPNCYFVFYKDQKVGDIEPTEDGFFVFWPPETSNGFWPDWMLLEICAKLRELNAYWELYIETDPNI